MLNFIRRFSWLLFAIVVFSAFLGQRGLNEPDEGRYAEVAREMSVDGDWLVPHLNGLPHFQKPPVIYWCTALSFRAFGYSERAARLPSALAALGTVILTFLLTRRLLGDRERAASAALVLTTLAGFFAMGRLLTPDMVMSFWIMAAVTAAMHQRRWLFFICMGLGFLTKGPMALVVPVCAVLGWEAFAEPDKKLGLHWARGMALTLSISLSWFIGLSLRDPALFDYFWKYELVERFGSGTHGRSKPFWFFAAVLPLALMPWIFLLPVRRIWHRCRTGDLRGWQGLLLGWTVPPLLLLSFSGSKLPTYILPLMPAFAVVVAAGLPTLKRRWVLALPAAVCLVAGDALVAAGDGYLGAQSSSRDLVQALKREEPDADEAILFACGTRTEGLAFYAGRLINITLNEADCVLPPTAAQGARLYPSAAACLASLSHGRPAHGIVSTSRFEKMFDPRQWRIIAQSGAFSLVANHGPHEPAKDLPEALPAPWISMKTQDAPTP